MIDRRKMFTDVPLPFGDNASSATSPATNLDTIDVKILTVKQPWATALLSGGKDVENRDWYTSYRGWLLVHAGKSVDEHVPASFRLGDPMRLPRGVVLGAVEITSVVRDRDSRWADRGSWHWCHDPKTAVALDRPLVWRGVQGLTRAPIELLAMLPAEFVDQIR